ncbi:hypothetical protein WA158_001309 [Blastocystis sp. Blastoise]
MSLSKQRLTRKQSTMVTQLAIDTTSTKYMLSGDSGGDVCLFDLDLFRTDVETINRAIKRVSFRFNKIGHKTLITSLQWYPIDNGLFISSSRDQTVKIWDTNKFEPVLSYKYKYSIPCVVMPRVGPFKHKLIGVCSNTSISFIDLYTGDHIHEYDTGSPTLTCDFNPINENEVCVGNSNGYVFFYDIRSNSEKSLIRSLNNHTTDTSAQMPIYASPVMSVRYTQDGLFLITVSQKGEIKIWDNTTGKIVPLYIASHNSWEGGYIQLDTYGYCGNNYLFYPDGNKGTISIYSLDTGKLMNCLSGHLDAVTCCAFRPDFNELYSGSRDGNILRYEYNNQLIEEEDVWED